jgi:NAD(P)-dependent dehydrogenase (short-subunit alcohol dehydrogenase family)
MATILVTGANRGIGLELVRQYANEGGRVIACCREPDEAADLHQLAEDYSSISIERMDVTNHESIEDLSDQYRSITIDILINNAGVIGPHPLIDNLPRQHFGTIDYDVWAEVMEINTFAPVKVAEAFLKQVAASRQKKIITLSSSVGSITESNIPAIAYASSKAAVNKAMSLVADKVREQGVIVTVICPGHVKTRLAMGGGDISVEESVAGMRDLFAKLSMADSGTFKRYYGELISW